MTYGNYPQYDILKSRRRKKSHPSRTRTPPNKPISYNPKRISRPFLSLATLKSVGFVPTRTPPVAVYTTNNARNSPA